MILVLFKNELDSTLTLSCMTSMTRQIVGGPVG